MDCPEYKFFLVVLQQFSRARGKPLIILGGGVGQNSEKKGSGADGKKEKGGTPTSEKKEGQSEMPTGLGENSKCLICEDKKARSKSLPDTPPNND